MRYYRKLIPMGTKTKWGKVVGVRCEAGERYYFILEKGNITTFFPADVVENGVYGEKQNNGA